MPHPRLAFHKWPAAVYAIGDVHGCLDHLLRLEDQIATDAGDIEGEKWLITLGDQIHVIKLVTPGTFIYLAAERANSNIAIVRTAVNKNAPTLV